jgi:hypothetical protein
MQSFLDTYGHEGMATQDFGTQQDVKKEVYRLTSLLVEQLSKFFRIFGQSSWQCVHEMRMEEIFTEDGAKNLLVALSITTELPLKCYQKQCRQKEALPTVPQLSVTEQKKTPCPFSTAIVRLYQSLIPLKTVILQILEVNKNHNLTEPERSVVSVLQEANFMDVSPMTTATAYLHVLQLPKSFEYLLSAKNNKWIMPVGWKYFSCSPIVTRWLASFTKPLSVAVRYKHYTQRRRMFLKQAFYYVP